MLVFDFNNTTKQAINRKLAVRINENFFKVSKLKGEWNYSLVFVGEARMKTLNRILRGKDKVTDVLSFEEADDGFIDGNSREKNLGEIIICPARALAQASKYGWSFDYEFARLLIHGLSHLLGYDHENVTDKVAQEMVDFEAKVMTSLKLRASSK